MILFFFSFCVTIYGQKWTYSSGGNAFDGKYKTSSVIGNGGEFPYQNPQLVVNLFDNGSSPNIYFADVGYAGCDDKIIYLNFDDNNKVYSFYCSTNSDKDVWFISYSQYHKSDLTTIELLNKFMNHSYVNVRLSSSCGKKDYKFPLTGSAIAINFVVNEWITKEIIKEKEQEKLNELKRLKEEEQAKLNEQKRLIEDSINQERLKANLIKMQLKEEKQDSLYLQLKLKYNLKNLKVMITEMERNLYKNASDITPFIKISKNTLIVINQDYFEKGYYKVIIEL